MGHRMRRSGTTRRVRHASALGAALSSGVLIIGAASATPAAAGGVHSPRGATYAALGDSYAAGPMIPRQVDANCARSDHNYPSLVAAARPTATFTDVSCAGATTENMWKPQGTNGPQLDALRHNTNLVTVQIGGNDVGFGSIIGTCVTLSAKDPAGNPCQQYYNASGSDRLTLNILETAPKVARVLRAVHDRAPRARVLVVGYPSLLPDDGSGCYPDVPLAAKDFPYLRDVTKRVNLMLRTVAWLNRAEYVDTYRPTIGHDMCKAPADRWIEPLRPASPAAPAHPNAKGEAVMGQVVLKVLNRGAAHH